MKKQLQTAFCPRQYMLSRDFELYYYSDTEFTGVDVHTHDYYEFYFFLEGDVCMKIQDRTHTLSFGDLVLIPPGVPHQALIRCRTVPYRRFVFWISTEFYRKLLALSPDYGYLIQSVSEEKEYVFRHDRVAFNEIQAKLLRILEELHADHFARDTQIGLCVNDLILHLNRAAYQKNHPQSKKGEQALHRNVLAYIEDHLKDDLSLEQLSRIFFVSKYHIAHVFKANLGISTHQYIIKKRLALCRAAMLGGAGSTEVYREFGFQDYSSFYRAFKKEYGTAPRAAARAGENRRIQQKAGKEHDELY